MNEDLQDMISEAIDNQRFEREETRQIYTGQFSLDQTESVCDWYDEREQRWRKLNQDTEDDLLVREANQILEYESAKHCGETGNL